MKKIKSNITKYINTMKKRIQTATIDNFANLLAHLFTLILVVSFTLSTLYYKLDIFLLTLTILFTFVQLIFSDSFLVQNDILSTSLIGRKESYYTWVRGVRIRFTNLAITFSVFKFIEELLGLKSIIYNLGILALVMPFIFLLNFIEKKVASYMKRIMKEDPTI
ncbi:MAG: hypothetical protein IAA89_02015 [Firmicutes bacterium]|uniref:Uncharacterized protein n=1 Tax=Candidatus Gallilactobacillus intestinavium TaxID=2840838 RepID=A0A9D9E615_9LACO|nr:hypothetical protein [Candidatus Gallilactobacillus intestinavium]